MTTLEDLLLEFIEVFIHSVLFLRNMYPSGVFTTHTVYHIPIQICLHPQVKQLIKSIIESLGSLLIHKNITDISMFILSETLEPIEKLTIELGHMTGDLSEVDVLEVNLRDALLRLFNKLTSAPTEEDRTRTWRVYANTRQPEETRWITAVEPQMPSYQIEPIKSIHMDCLKLQLLYINGH